MKFSVSPNPLPRCAVVISLLAFAPRLMAAPVPNSGANVGANFTAREDGYAVWFPNKPQSGSRQIVSDGQAVNARYALSKSGGVTYLILPIRLPSRIPNAKRAEFLEGAQRGFVQSLRSAGGRLQSSRALTLRGFMGREMTAQVPPNGMRARFMVASRRSYQIVIVGSNAALNKSKSQIDKVLNSFQILTP